MRRRRSRFDLSGVIAAAELRAAPKSALLLALACVITGNVIDVSLTAAESSTLPAVAYWDLQLTYSSGAVQTIVAGGVSVRADITGPFPGAREVAHA